MAGAHTPRVVKPRVVKPPIRHPHGPVQPRDPPPSRLLVQARWQATPKRPIPGKFRCGQEPKRQRRAVSPCCDHHTDDDSDAFSVDNLWSLVVGGGSDASFSSGSDEDEEDSCATDEYISELSRRTSLTPSASGGENAVKARPTIAPRLLQDENGCRDWSPPKSRWAHELSPKPKKMPSQPNHEWEADASWKRRRCEKSQLALAKPLAVGLRPGHQLTPTTQLEDAKLGASANEAGSKPPGHYDFIEVGTSDWGTITQYCAGLRTSESGFGGTMLISCEAKAPPGSIVGANGRVLRPRGSMSEYLTRMKQVQRAPPVAASTVCNAAEQTAPEESRSLPQKRVRKPQCVPNRPRNARGLAVEAMQEHLVALPSLPHVTKVVAAMDENCGSGILYCVSGENIARYMGRYHAKLPGSKTDKVVDVMWYAKSLASLGSPQPELKGMLEQIGRVDLLEERRVQVLNWSELCRLHGVRSVDVVQLDCEGKDCAILRSLMSHCKSNRAAYPRLIMFEANHLTEKTEKSETVAALKERGYRTLSKNKNNLVMERTWTPSVASDTEAGRDVD